MKTMIAKIISDAVMRGGLATVIVFSLSAAQPASAFGFDENWMPFDTSPPAARGSGLKQSAPVASNKTPLISTTALKSLAQASSKYQNIVERGGWQKISQGELLVVGAVSPRVKLLRKRLRMTGDLKQRAGFKNTYDSFVAEGVKTFQKRHGLRQSGRVNKHTLIALNVSAEHRLSQIRLNLQRLEKRLKHAVPSRFVMVNIAASELEAVESGQVAQTHKVVVGKPEFQTPVLNAKIVELNFYPYWHVPNSIARRDILPQLVKGKNYLEKTRTRVLEKWGGKQLDPATIDWQSPEAQKYKFRQDPGKDNALGVLRFNMPNGEAVYLHETPMKRLFGNNVRAYSAGCVRVHNVDQLAAWLLRPNAGWGLPRIKDTIREGQSRNVALKNKTPVYLAYFTAWAFDNGKVQFRRDIYQRDKFKGNEVVSNVTGGGSASQSQASIGPRG